MLNHNNSSSESAYSKHTAALLLAAQVVATTRASLQQCMLVWSEESDAQVPSICTQNLIWLPIRQCMTNLRPQQAPPAVTLRVWLATRNGTAAQELLTNTWGIVLVRDVVGCSQTGI